MVLANATSVGMKPNIHLTPIPKEALKHYSLILLTRLLRESQEAGAAEMESFLCKGVFLVFGVPCPDLRLWYLAVLPADDCLSFYRTWIHKY
ncbi:hypothetical protein K1719_030143 [Acacia pycnantha]|nr:hypothetical protein K1719_030143 [Acacia pycnantha]